MLGQSLGHQELPEKLAESGLGGVCRASDQKSRAGRAVTTEYDPGSKRR